MGKLLAVTDEPGSAGAAAIAGHMGDEGAARAFLRDGAPDVRAAAFGALARMGAITDADLRAGLGDPDPVVRRRCVALAVPHPAVALVPMLADDDGAVAEQAAWALGERDPAEPGAVAALARAATGADDALVREAAVAALGALGDEAGLPAILQATTDRPAIRRRAVLALAPFDGPDVAAALTRAAADRDWQVRQAAETILDP
ncbi:MAG: HEAT repeat domain-containing protein [Acidobacteria bacterium]|nr:HEAT repeat domain-containing protein [Acidobacteriota bacterium]